MIKKSIFITYCSFVTLVLISFSFSALYYNKLDEKIYEEYLPKVRIYPRYNAIGEVTNKEEVTIWKDSDFVPWYGIASYRISFFIKVTSGGFYLLALLLYMPTLLYILLIDRKKTTIMYCIILAFELAICLYLIRLLPPP